MKLWLSLLSWSGSWMWFLVTVGFWTSFRVSDSPVEGMEIFSGSQEIFTEFFASLQTCFWQKTCIP